MTNVIVTTKQVSESRKNYYSVFINGKAVCEIRFPASNPYLSNKTLQELAELEANRILLK